MSGSRLRNLLIILGLLLAGSQGLSRAQEPGPQGAQPQGGNAPAALLEDAIPIQGRLSDAGGSPLAGDHSVTFSIYDGEAAAVPLCSTNYNPLPLTNGLFNATVTGCTASQIHGSQLFLGIQVDDDEEMAPRQPIYAVPYARSLRPGTAIWGSPDGLSILNLVNESEVNGSLGLFAYAKGAAGVNYGVYGRSDSPAGYGGYFENMALDGVGLFARGGTSSAADLVLGGRGNGGNDDDGRISSDPFYAGSDIFLVSNDAIMLDLDNNNDEDGDLEVRNSSKDDILKASENGNVHLGIDAGSTMTITVGDRYRDNAIVAWAKIMGTGVGSIQSEFGISSVDHSSVGVYKIYLDANAASNATLIPMAIAEIDTAPTDAAHVRIVSVNQVGLNTFEVFINDGSWNLVDNDFVFMVTAR